MATPLPSRPLQPELLSVARAEHSATTHTVRNHHGVRGSRFWLGRLCVAHRTMRTARDRKRAFALHLHHPSSVRPPEHRSVTRNVRSVHTCTWVGRLIMANTRPAESGSGRLLAVDAKVASDCTGAEISRCTPRKQTFQRLKTLGYFKSTCLTPGVPHGAELLWS